MDKGQHLYFVFEDAVKQAVARDEEFANARIADFGNDASAVSKLSKRSCRVSRFANECRSVPWRVLRDVCSGRFEISPAWRGPDYSPSHFAIRRSTSSWLITSPRSAA